MPYRRRGGDCTNHSLDADDDEEAPLLLVSPTARMRQNHRGVLWNRVLAIALLAALVAFAIAAELQLRQLAVQLESERSQTAALQSAVADHDRVIRRFNASLTNADVAKRLHRLESRLDAAVHDLQQELGDAESAVAAELAQTVRQLNTTVAAAEAEISAQVVAVKKDVEQYVVATQDQFSMENSFMVYQLAGTFTLLSCLISMWHMSAHLGKLNQPQVQRKILAILWMSPLYAVTSWFSLVFPAAEGYLAIVKDFYEAYVIYQFLSFCIAVLGRGDRGAVVDLLARRAPHLTPPFRLGNICRFLCCGRCCRREPYESDRQLADEILLQCQLFAMQFVFLRPLTTTAVVVLAKLEYYGPWGATGAADYRAPQCYIAIVQNVSIFTAFAGLLKFYHAVDQDLAWCRPFAKFLCIKGVVFMTFWQGLAISILAQTTDLGSSGGGGASGTGGDPEEWAKSAQNFLICLEMLLFSIAHFYCFPTEEWEEGYRVKHSQGKFGDSIALGDFLDDLKLIVKANVRHSNKKHHKRHSGSKKQQPTIPEGDEDTSTSEEEEESPTNSDNNNNHHSPPSTAASGTTSLEDEERAVVAALEESLGSVSDDPDIVEAKKRLIESHVLSPDFFVDDDDDDYEIHNDSDVEASTEEVRRRLHEESSSSVDVKDDDEEEEEDASAPLNVTVGADVVSSAASPSSSFAAAVGEAEEEDDELLSEVDESEGDDAGRDNTNNGVNDPSIEPNEETTTSPMRVSSAAPVGSPPPPSQPPPPPPTERTGLLSPTWNPTYHEGGGTATERNETTAGQQHDGNEDGGSPFVEALRPSIFTTVASLAEIERRASGQKDETNRDSGHG